MDPGLVDVEWADGEGGGLRKSVLGAVSWVPFESVLPPRRVLPGPSEEAATTVIDQACRMLRLPTVRGQFPDLAGAASREQMSYRRFLAELLLAECDDRARRRLIAGALSSSSRC